jgi:hypothetical protein
MKLDAVDASMFRGGNEQSCFVPDRKEKLRVGSIINSKCISLPIRQLCRCNRN